MEKNELLEIWKEFDAFMLMEFLDDRKKNECINYSLFQYKYYGTEMLYFRQLKAKMDLQDALIKEQKKQILACFEDNALLHKRLKKCQEENKKLNEWRQRWQNYFNEFQIKYLDIEPKSMEVRDMIDELAIQLEAFMGW